MKSTPITQLDPAVFKFGIWRAGVTLVTLIIACVMAAGAMAKPAPQSQSSNSASVDQPVELGDVHWLRDLDTAVSDSKKEDKPIAILFQEVPG